MRPTPRLLPLLATGFALALPVTAAADAAETDLPSIRVPLAEGSLVTDGSLDESAWSSAARLTLNDPWKQKGHPLEPTEVLLLRTKDALHIAFLAADREILATRTERDDRTHRDDCVEIFLTRARETNGEALGMEINALGTVADFYYRHAGWYNHGWQPSITRIVSRREDRLPLKLTPAASGYIVEIEIPWKELYYALPEKDEITRLRANFARWNYGKEGRIMTTWVDPKLATPKPLLPDRFGWLVFED